MGYHKREIAPGVYGEISKIREELEELEAWAEKLASDMTDRASTKKPTSSPRRKGVKRTMKTSEALVRPGTNS